MNDYKSEFTIKNTIFFFIFVVICVIGVVNVLLPRIESYKKQLTENRREELIYNQALNEYNKTKDSLRALIEENALAFDRLYTATPTEKQLQERIKRYFVSLKVKKRETRTDNLISYTKFDVSGFMANNTKVLEFLEQMSNLENIVQINAPLIVREDKASKTLNVFFSLEVIQSHYTPSEIILQEDLQYKHPSKIPTQSSRDSEAVVEFILGLRD